MMQHELEYYIDRLAEGTISTEEWKLLQDQLQLPHNSEVLAAILDRQLVQLAEDTVEYPDVIARVQAGVANSITAERNSDPYLKRRVPFIRRWWAAASIILLLGAGAYFWSNKKNTQPVTITKTADPAPGKNGAILILADGSQMVLDSMENGTIALQNGSRAVIKNGELAYNTTAGTGGEIMYNTMHTPRGRQFSLLLSDGTRIWLNAASSIRYPTVFTGNDRRVEVSGEAYFEVAKNPKMPFRVVANKKAEVEVLGTHFNINAYGNEKDVYTTLLEGSVRVMPLLRSSANSPAVTLKPGQQAQIQDRQADPQASTSIAKTEIKVINNTDIDKVMAWKNGQFNFEGASLEEVMKQLERWYDIEIIYEKGIPDITFGGKMTRGLPLSGVLIALKKSEVHFKLEGRKLIVMP